MQIVSFIIYRWITLNNIATLPKQTDKSRLNIIPQSQNYKIFSSLPLVKTINYSYKVTLYLPYTE